MKKRILWITQTAVMLALLIGLQALTRPAGQFVTGSCVNLILALSVLVGGFWCGLTVALLSNLFAFLLGIGPALLPLVPAVAVGNAVIVIVLYLLCRKPLGQRTFKGYALSTGGMVVAAFAKFFTLWLVVTQLVLPLLPLLEEEMQVMIAMFTWPQLFTALIGGTMALLAAPLIMRALKREIS